MLELLASEYRILAQDILALTLCLLALIWGGGPERAVAATWLIVFELANWIHEWVLGLGIRLTDVDVFLAAMDAIAGVLWITIALYANRNYTLWIAGMQLLAMTAHLARGLVEAVSPIAYLVMVVAPGWFQLVLLGVGLTRHVLRKRKYGPYRDWRIVPNWHLNSGEGRDRNRLVALLGHDFFAEEDRS